MNNLWRVYYAWLRIGDIEVYVADIDEEDEKLLINQINAVQIGLTSI